MREYIIRLTEEDCFGLLVPTTKWFVIKKILNQLRKQIRGGEQSMTKTREEFEAWEACPEQKALYEARKAAVETFMKGMKDTAYTARDIADKVGIGLDDAYTILQTLSMRKITRNGYYYVWGK